MKNNSASFIIFCAVCSAAPFMLFGMELQIKTAVSVLLGLSALLAFYPFCSIDASIKNFSSIRCFPPFYFCLALCAYVAIQSANVSAEYVKNDGIWSFYQFDFAKFLPSSVAAAYPKNTLYSDLPALTAAFAALVCARIVLSDIERIKSFCTLVFFAAATAAAVTVLERMTGMWIVPWHSDTLELASRHVSINSFFAVSLGFGGMRLAISLNSRINRPVREISILAGIAVVLGAIAISGGMGGTVAGCAIAAVIALSTLIQSIFRQKYYYPAFIAAGAVFIACAGACAYKSGAQTIESAVERLSQRISSNDSIESRMHIWKISSDMIASGGDYNKFLNGQTGDWNNVVFGRGLGSYESLSDPYSVNNSQIQQKNPAGLRYTAGHAHCDPLQILFEFGILGSLAIAAWLLWFAAKLLDTAASGGLKYEMIPPFFAVIILVAYSVFDHPIYKFFTAVNLVVLSVAALNYIEFVRRARILRNTARGKPQKQGVRPAKASPQRV